MGRRGHPGGRRGPYFSVGEGAPFCVTLGAPKTRSLNEEAEAGGFSPPRSKLIHFFPTKEKQRVMAKTVCTILGAVFILVGLVGFVMPGFLGTHLSALHNVVHLASGALALYFGLKGTLSGAKMFCLAFGAVYLLLGLAGFLLGGAQQHTVSGITHGTDSRLLQVIPGQLELASMDHTVHVLLGIVFLVGGLMSRPDVDRAVERAT